MESVFGSFQFMQNQILLVQLSLNTVLCIFRQCFFVIVNRVSMVLNI